MNEINGSSLMFVSLCVSIFLSLISLSLPLLPTYLPSLQASLTFFAGRPLGSSVGGPVCTGLCREHGSAGLLTPRGLFLFTRPQLQF